MPTIPAALSAELLALAALHCRHAAPRLAESDLAEQLEVLTGWSRSGNSISKRFAFDDFRATIAFVNALAFIADREDHHPELRMSYGWCAVEWSTHDAGGVTINDVISAAKVERLLAA